MYTTMPDQSQDRITLRFRMPDGSTKTWRFDKNSIVQDLYSYVFANLSEPVKFKLSTSYPRKDLNDLYIDFGSAGIGDMENIMVSKL